MHSNETSVTWTKTYYESFDGLRGIAVLLVLVRHFGATLWSSKLVYGAWVGVDLFFVLSGFLITGILFDGLDRPRYFQNFYVRRALRIFPLFYGFFVALLLLSCVVTVHYSSYVWTYALYVGNLVQSWVDLGVHNPNVFWIERHGTWHIISLGHLWSLCVEEQFYLIWPVTVFLVRSRKRLMQVCVAGAVVVLALRCGLYAFAGQRFLDNGGIYFCTFTRVDTLLVGSWLALWLRGATPSRNEMRRITGWLMGSSLALLVGGALLTVDRWPSAATNPFLSTVGYTLIALLMAGILLRSLDEQGWLYRMLRAKTLSMVGLTSYGVYFLHNFLVCPVDEVTHRWLVPHHVGWVGPMMGIVVSLLLARVSFFYFEMPFLRLKPILAPSKGAVQRPAAGPTLRLMFGLGAAAALAIAVHLAVRTHTMAGSAAEVNPAAILSGPGHSDGGLAKQREQQTGGPVTNR